MTLVSITKRLRTKVDALSFADPVTHVYDPLAYAWKPHAAYLERWGKGPKEAVFVGMNPGPFGMAQTGVPFGEVSMVRDFVGVSAPVTKPANEHPKRPIDGFACTRSEVSGQRFWGWAKERFGTADAFFARFFVINYCPLVFMEKSGKNRVPERLPIAEREPLFAACDEALAAMIAELSPKRIIGVGTFAEDRARETLGAPERGSEEPNTTPYLFGSVLHPSPANPRANAGWAQLADAQLAAMGVRP